MVTGTQDNPFPELPWPNLISLVPLKNHVARLHGTGILTSPWGKRQLGR